MPRARRQLALAGLTFTVTAAAWLAGSAAGRVDRASLATAWLCLALFVAVLLLGPAQVLAGRRPAANQAARRDLGIWTALTGLAHFGLGNLEAMNRPYLQAAIGEAAGTAARLREGLFTWGVSLGTLVAVLFLALLALSNNWSLARLGPVRWKRWQRLSYLAFALTALHGVMFQLLEGRAGGWIGVLLAATAAVAGLQLAARRARRAPAGGMPPRRL